MIVTFAEFSECVHLRWGLTRSLCVALRSHRQLHRMLFLWQTLVVAVQAARVQTSFFTQYIGKVKTLLEV